MAQISFIVALITFAAFTQAAYIPYPYYSYPSGGHTPAITSVSSNILRTPGNLGQISTYHKSIDTPFSSVRKADVRISNDAVAPVATAVHVTTPFHVPTTPVHALHAVHAAPVAIAYSAAPAVAHLTFDGFGTHYAW